MGNTVYTRERVKAIVEETRLNAHPDSNRSLYDVLQNTKQVLGHPLAEALDPLVIGEFQEQLAAHHQSYAAWHYQRELSAYQAIREAHSILEGRTVFDLAEVAYSIRNLWNYSNHNAAAHAYRQELDNLWMLVQKGKLHKEGVLPIAIPEEMKLLLQALTPYRGRSAEISGVHTYLQRELRQLQKIGEGISN